LRFPNLKPLIVIFPVVLLLSCVNLTSQSYLPVNTSTVVAIDTITADNVSTLQPFSPTTVPSGVFAILFYPPLVMDYDPSKWDDKSEYTDRSIIVNYLQAKELSTCRVGIQGPTGFYGTHKTEDIILGGVYYTILLLPDSFSSDYVFLFYLEGKSLSGYNYELHGLPVFGIGSIPSEWEECNKLGEEVLSTLHVP
jgi:hypothetical protein